MHVYVYKYLEFCKSFVNVTDCRTEFRKVLLRTISTVLFSLAEGCVGAEGCSPGDAEAFTATAVTASL